ncbi:MAG: DUF3850 domain-containing protein, partial [Actinobacteria bacterium]|nr:DUF3850 domain-containing protein [Actinomycetota bacterium]
LSGCKTLDVRINDRGYRAGDTLILREFDPHGRTVVTETQVETQGTYTGRSCQRLVTHVLLGGVFGIEAGYVALSLAPPVQVVHEYWCVYPAGNDPSERGWFREERDDYDDCVHFIKLVGGEASLGIARREAHFYPWEEVTTGG